VGREFRLIFEILFSNDSLRHADAASLILVIADRFSRAWDRGCLLEGMLQAMSAHSFERACQAGATTGEMRIAALSALREAALSSCKASSEPIRLARVYVVVWHKPVD